MACDGFVCSRYDADYNWSQKGRIVLDPPADRVEIRLYPKKSPLAVENFVALCIGFKGKSSNTGKPLHYKGCPFHRVVTDFVAQAGDIATGTGAGGESIWGKKFKDDKDGLKIPLDKRGLVAACNQGKNTNTSQFFFSLGPTPKLTGKHVVFGEITQGIEVLDAIETAAVRGKAFSSSSSSSSSSFFLSFLYYYYDCLHPRYC